MATRIRTLNFLPEIFQTTTNAQILAASLDQLVAQPNTKRIEGYVGSKFGYGINANDYYVTEPNKVRTDYQLDPGVVFLKENSSTATDFISYPGIVDALKLEGGLTTNSNRLFPSQFYSWDSFTNLDKIINFNQYYWLPEGPERVTVATNIVYNSSNYSVTDTATAYLISSETQPVGSFNPTITLLRGGSYTFSVSQDSQFWIQGEPGVTGYSATQPNLQTRNVFGVINNGSENGVVTFNVPQQNALNEYNFPTGPTVGVVSTLPFSQVNGARVNDIGGIDGVTALDGLTVMFYNTGVPNEIGYSEQFFNQTLYDEAGGVPYTEANFPGTSVYNNNYEGGFYSYVNANFYTITLIPGDDNNPIIQLVPAGVIPTNQTITPVYGNEWININFYRDVSGIISVVPYNSAILDTLYYQDGTSPTKVGIIKLVNGNASNQLNIETEILGKLQYTAPNGVVFTNGLKVLFQGDIYPASYANVEYYVEGVGTAIELIPVSSLVSPGVFATGAFIPYDTLPYGIGNYDSSLYVPIEPDYITISRNAMNRNAWARSNRWFHIDVITATANYNNTPELVTELVTLANKAKRPIIEFYPNLQMFDSGVVGKNPIDFIDTRTLDAFSEVAGKTNYYPDVAGWTAYNSTIAPVTGAIVRTATETIALTNQIVINTTAGLNINDTITFSGTVFGGVTAGTIYYITDILDTAKIVISATKQGTALTLASATGTMSASIYPYSTTITIPTASVSGFFEVGQYLTDSTGVLPSITFITNVATTLSTTILTVSWYNQSVIAATSIASIVTADTPLDNYGLFDGARVVFAADTTPDVRNKIYVCRFSSISSTISTPIITLTEAADGLVLPNEQTAVYRGYNYQGKDFYFNGIDWVAGQQKTTINQAPMFDIFDKNNISFGDSSVYVGTSFIGSTLFSYGLGTGRNDLVLGIPLRYSSVDNVGDISFDVTLNSQTFDYVRGTSPVTQKVNTGYVFNYTGDAVTPVRQLGWQTAVSPSVQYQVFEFDWNIENTSNNTFKCDIAPIVTTPTNWPLIQVYVNNKYLPKEDWTSISDDSTTTVIIDSINAVETVVQILILSDQVSSTAYFQPPINLSNNPLNEDITTANIGDIRGQYQSIFFNNPNTMGDVFGKNNYRDLGNLVPWGNSIIQNSASVVLPGVFLRKQNHNLFNALMYNSRQYITFKTLLIDTVTNNSTLARTMSAAEMFDLTMDIMVASKNDEQPFFWSDMVPTQSPYATNSYSFANALDVSIYPLSKIYNFATSNYNGVLVYLTRNQVMTQLLVNIDYTISTDAPSLTLTLDLLPNDIITINEYNQTYGSYVPNTPTKLGLYPASIPNVILDSSYTTPTYFIQGHDGSYNKLYGNYDATTGVLSDFRDKVLLEFETRVFNNLKLSNTIPVQAYEVLPGFFRQTDYSYAEFLQIYSESFLNWVGQNRIEYKRQVFNKYNEFTFNYADTGNKLNGEPIEQGYFRGLYLFYYDTTTPDKTPWEMIGYNTMPAWWTARYGAAPYTSNNLVLWNDLANGIDWNNGNPVVLQKYIRAGLLNVLPVDSQGNLVSPFVSITGNYTDQTFRNDWKVGDVGPAEFSYRRSSSWPFDLMRILALTKPAQFFNLAVDVDRYKFNSEFNQYLVDDRSHLVVGDIPIYGSGTPATSYINWIVDFEKQVGIDATTTITTLLDNLDVRLVYRLAGFSDKTQLKFYVEKSSANSNNSSLLIPDESYSVLLYENQPFDKIVYSGVVVQITNTGYKVFGNSQNNAYFKILVPKNNGKVENITIENITVALPMDFTDKVELIPYGTEFYDPQQVALFLTSYGHYLESQGVIYEQIENGIPVNWSQMVAEYLYWSQIGWEVGSITTINPSATILAIDKDSHIVQPLTLQQQNFVLNQNLYPIQGIDLSVVRDGTAFTAQPLNQGDAISYGQFNISNIEHGVVFDNKTLFNDVIYNLGTGLRQNRIFVRGSKTADWNGTLDAAGFILNQDNIAEWTKEVKYTKGSIVKYKNRYWTALTIVQAKELFDERDWKQTDYDQIQKGLLANSSTRSYESTLYYDVHAANLEKDADLLSFSLIGYRPRDYLATADLTDITQVNVYQNLIKDKGTLNAASAFKGATLAQGGIDYDIYENWSILSGEFGGTLNNNFIEFKLNEESLTGNPAIVGLTDGTSTNDAAQQEVFLYSVFNYGRPINDPAILSTISSDEPSTVFPDAGYVNLYDVKMASYFFSGLGTAVNSTGTRVPVSDFYVRDYVWLANYLSTWQVYTPTSLGSIIGAKNNLNGTVTLTFSQAHTLVQYDIFAVVNFNPSINGYYVVAGVVNPFSILINLSLNPAITSINGLGIGFGLQSQRVATAPEIAALPLLNNEFNKVKVWVDTNTDGSWAVYRKSLNYQYDKEIVKQNSYSFGSAVAHTDNMGYLIGDATAGIVYRYTYDSNLDSYTIDQTITQGTSFGSAISYSGDLFVISEPTTASKVYVYQLVKTTLVDNVNLYQTINAPGGITNWGSSTAISGDQNWLYISDTEHALVYVYRKSTITNLYENVSTLSVAGVVAADAFGYSLATDYYGDTVVVGTPYKNYDVNTDDYGYTYVFSRTVQNFEARTASQSFTPLQFPLAWTPATLSTTASSITSNAITLSSVSGLVAGALGTPIVFTGTSFGGILANTVYYVKTIVGSTITIAVTRNGTAVTLINSSGTMTATGQTTPLFVSINGTLTSDNNYAVTNSTLNMYNGFTTLVNAGDIVNVSGYNFVLTQPLTNEETPRVGVEFGTSVATNKFANEILVGAPFELNDQNNEGAVHRYSNGGERYGIIVGTTNCNITTPRTILLNGYAVTLPAGDATVAANAINLVNLTNITASAVQGKLVIRLVDITLAIPNSKLVLDVVNTSTLAELGITLYKQTQKILCPHLEGATQFGTVVKFNDAGSFVASAPAGTRYTATTFDFTDDELDNDTVFDNNATQWIDTFANAGAVYMFDYLGANNESLANTGKFVYAQSTNAQNLDYGNQPMYGNALDFSNTRVTIGTANFKPTNNTNDIFGQVVGYVNATGTTDWSVFRNSSPIVDINKIGPIQLFSASTNDTLENLDYIDPLQGKILGSVRENIDVVSNADPAGYNSPGSTQRGIIWGAEKVGQIWFNTTNTRFMNYHQNDIVYNSKYWGRVFPGSDVSVYTWITSNVPPAQYQGPGSPFNIDNYVINGTLNAQGAIVPIYFFWVRNTNIIFTEIGKTLSDSIIQRYIAQPQATGISYFAPLLPEVFALYNSGDFINANDTVLHIGYSTGNNDDVSHTQYSLIRDGYPDDFLSGIPGSGAAYQNRSSVGITQPIGLYNRMLDSMAGVDNSGGVVPDPFLPRAVQTGVLARPRQSFFYNRFGALKNYLEYANQILAQFPIVELRNSQLLNSKNNEVLDENDNILAAAGQWYDTTNYWSFVNWWAPGYNDNTKASVQVAIYADLSTLDVVEGTIANVLANPAATNTSVETYVYQAGVWKRIGLQNGTIEFSSALWDYSSARLGFGDNFFDTTAYDEYPSEETRYIIRALNEEIYTNELLIYRNKSLILLFEYIQSETIESQNYLTWLNKTSFIDVSHTIRELRPIEVFRSDNQVFLEGYLNEIKPYHVVIKDFLFNYTGTDVFEGEITDFDIPSTYNANVQQFISPELVYTSPSGDNQYLATDPIWSTAPYSQWFNNYGLSIVGQPGHNISVLASYLSLNSNSCYVDNATGFPVTGTITIGTEQIGYSSVDLLNNQLLGLVRGVNSTAISTHIPSELIYIDLPAVLVLNSGRAYSEPPKVIAYIDTSIYPAPRVQAQFEAVMAQDKVIAVTVINPGEGYAALPSILIDAAITVTIDPTQVNLTNNTLELTEGVLVTGDLVTYTPAPGSTQIGGLAIGQHYYIGRLETTPSTIIALYSSYINAAQDHNRVLLTSTGIGNQTLNLTAVASCVTNATPVRENNISLRFDRTTYESQVIDWMPSGYYGSFYAGTFSNSNQVSSSSIGLESSQPPIGSILASAAGAAFEILTVENQQTLNWSSRTRSTVQMYGPATSYPNAIRVNPELGGAEVYGTVGSTIGFYIGMPIKFEGEIPPALIGTIANYTTYYVQSLVKLPNPTTLILEDTGFTISATVDVNGNPGSVIALATTSVPAAGLTMFVGELTNTAVLTINYSGIRTATTTVADTNNITVLLTATGQNGTDGFYTGLPIFFVGNVFGGIEENKTYYITTVIDLQTFTMSESETLPVIVNVTATNATGYKVTCDTTTTLSVNEPIIFTGSTFGNIVAGITYYVREIFSGGTTFSIATSINGNAVILTTASGACLVTSQKNTIDLTSASGNMTLNVALPISPGQINCQQFTLYNTSQQYTNISGTVSNLLTRDMTASLATVNRLCLSQNGNKLDNIYANLQFNLDADFGGLTVAGGPYTINGTGTTSVTVSSTSSTGNWLTLLLADNPNTTSVLYVGMPLYFSGTSIGGISIGQAYYVYSIDASPPIGTGRFTISSYNTLDTVLAVTNDNGLLTGTGDPYITISGGYSLLNSLQTATITNASPAVITVSNGSAFTNGTAITFGSYGTLPLPLNNITKYYVINKSGNTFNIAYTALGTAINTISAGTGTHWVREIDTIITQQTAVDPQFDVSYILGGYRTVVTTTGSGYAVDNKITVFGNLIGGSSTQNDLILTVLTVNSSGGVTSVIASGQPSGSVNQYYFEVISETQVAVYSNAKTTAAVSGQNFPYKGVTSTTATVATASTDRFTVTSSSSFAVNDPVIFTGTVFGGVTLGQTYYILSKPTSTTVTVSETVGGSVFNIAVNDSGSMTMAKSGDYAVLPEPFYFNPSVVKYNNRIYQCVVSNNDQDFILGKWELLGSDNRKINALDRIVGYYNPTANMPGYDLTQLVSGITYPNGTYLGNPFAPDDQFTLDTVLIDQPFYPTGINMYAIVWNGTNYVTAANTDSYSAINISTNGVDWVIDKLANQPIEITDFIYAGPTGGKRYVITTNNSATPVLVSDGTTFDFSAAAVPSTAINSIAYNNNLYVAVGNNIVSSINLLQWDEVYTFLENGLTNTFKGITHGSTSGFTGFVTVGFGQYYNAGQVADTAIIFTSVNGFNWYQVSFDGVTNRGFNAIASNNQTFVAVGDNGIIYTSFNTIDWFAQSSGTLQNLRSIIWDNVNSAFVAVGDNGTILTAPLNGITWTIRTSGTTSNLLSVVYSALRAEYVAVGFDNAVLKSTNLSTWVLASNFETDPTVYNVQGDDFTAGYGPEELVPGVVSDTLTMIVATRPGTNWDPTIYQHVGYNVVSVELTPTSGSQTRYSFANAVSTPAQVGVFKISYNTELSTSYYENIDYTIDWINKVVVLNSPLNFINPGTDKLRIDVYEVGNGDQLVKADTETDPIRYNEITGFNEIYVNANYTDSIYQGSGVIRPSTEPQEATAYSTNSVTDAITFDSVEHFVLNGSIRFTGDVFGNIVEDTVYYVKTISYVSRRITVSESYNTVTGTAGPTFSLTNDTGSMSATIQVGTGIVWTPPAVYHNGTLMVLGQTGNIVATKGITNTIVTNTSSGLIANTPVRFSLGITSFNSNILPNVTYYIKAIYDPNEFTISTTPGGAEFELNTGYGGALFITNDFAFGIAENGISASIILADQHNTDEDYISYALFGETLPAQLGYTIPQVQTFVGDAATASFSLNNYVDSISAFNAIVEINGVRQNKTAYDISTITNSILFYAPPALNATIAVTTYNLTDRQYFSTQYQGSGTSGAVLNITVSNTTHSVGLFDENSPNIGTFDQNSPTVVLFDQVLDYLTLGSGTTASLPINAPIVFSSTIGGIIAGQVYYITTILSSTTFAISTSIGGLPIVVTTASGSMIGVINGQTVANIISINNAIAAPTQVLCSATVAGPSNYIVCSSTASLYVDEPILFASSTPGSIGGVDTTGTYYFVNSIIDSNNFTIKTQYGTIVTLTNSSTTFIGYAGGIPAIRVTTGVNHGFSDNSIVRIDGTTGSVQLNNNTYYTKVVTNTVFDLYSAVFNPALNAVNSPVTFSSSYTGGGYAWLDELFTIATSATSKTSANYNRITVTSTTGIVPGTPVYFTTSGSTQGSLILSNIQSKVKYYVLESAPTMVAGNFIVGNQYQIVELGSTDWNTAAGTIGIIYSVGSTFTAAAVGSGTGSAKGLQEFTITQQPYPNEAQVVLTDATGTVNVSQFEQVNVDRLWVTINGYRVPSSSLRLNSFNNLSILSTITTGDVVIITSMMPTATPNEEVYVLNVSTAGNAAVYRANTQTRTWLIHPLQYSDSVIYLNDVTRVTDEIVQQVTTPSLDPVTGTYNIGLTSNKNVICHLTVYNNSTSTMLNQSSYEIVVVETAPILRISAQVAVGNSLTITSIEGNLLYINGEQIGYNECDLALNTVSGLTRGANGTGQQLLIPKYSEAFGIIPNNRMSDVLYSQEWNPLPGIYNQVDGDPLQIAYSQGADFLRTDRN